MEPTAAICRVCGAAEPERPLTWTAESGAAGLELVCERCTRANLRAMEAKLDEEFW